MDRMMSRTLNKLSTIKVQRLKKKGLYSDGGGLYLRVAAGGSKGWVFRYRVHERLRDMGLGSIHALSLADARQAAAECRKQRQQGIDPIANRRAERAAQRIAEAKAMTFRQCAESYITDHEASWRNAKHRAQWPNTLKAYVYPVFGDLPVQAVDTGLVMQIIQPLWKSRTETASRVRGRIESILDWAKAHGYCDGENPARWRGHIEKLLPARTKARIVVHLAALPYAEVGAFVAKVRRHDSAQARALEFLILTAARLGEVLGANWREIDLRDDIWTIPAARMKGGREHRVPLSSASVAVLKAMHAIRHGEFVFPGAREGRPVAPITVLTLAKQIGGTDTTLHGFRSSFRDWAAERTTFQREVVEMALAHAIPDAVEAAYRRGDLLDKRRRLMNDWAKFCGKPNGVAMPIRRAQ
jgi:integrase